MSWGAFGAFLGAGAVAGDYGVTLIVGGEWVLAGVSEEAEEEETTNEGAADYDFFFCRCVVHDCVLLGVIGCYFC